MKLLSLIVTCYNEQDNILNMYLRAQRVLGKLPSYKWEIIYVDNNSTDNSEIIYTKLARKDNRVKVILMSRNFGSPQPSFLAGIAYARGDAAVLLHGDIQDPPEIIPKFIKKWQEGYDVVYGVRSSRKGYGFIWNFLYKLFYYLLHKLAYIQIPLNAGEFSLMDKRVYRELLKIDEYDYYVRCLRAFVGFKQIGITYERQSREHGRSTENILTSLWWAKTIIVNFSFKPLEWISLIGFVVTFSAFAFLILNIFLIFLFHNSPRGIPTVVILILFIGGVQLLSLSIIAEYLAKIFLEVKRRPKYIVRKFINI